MPAVMLHSYLHLLMKLLSHFTDKSIGGGGFVYEFPVATVTNDCKLGG